MRLYAARHIEQTEVGGTVTFCCDDEHPHSDKFPPRARADRRLIATRASRLNASAPLHAQIFPGNLPPQIDARRRRRRHPR